MDIQSVVLSNDLLAWAEKAGAKFRRAGSEWRSHCPIHGGDNNQAFAVYTNNGKQMYKCFTHDCGCGDVLDFVMRWQGCDKMTAYRMLGGEEQPDPVMAARAAEETARRAIADMEAKMEQYQRVLEDLRRTQSWITHHRRLLEDDKNRELWRRRGIINAYQEYWELGYCDDFVLNFEGAKWHTPTLTIPIRDGSDQIVNMRHRLLSPPMPNDKYRPDRPGLQAAPFIAFRGLGWDTDPILVVEGEIKSMVTMQTIYSDGCTVQVVGIPGKTAYRGILDQLQGHDVYICFDPDADKEAEEAARAVNGKVMTIPMKIDDAILAGCLDRQSLQLRMKAARKA
jgi:hypothetical protein